LPTGAGSAATAVMVVTLATLGMAATPGDYLPGNAARVYPAGNRPLARSARLSERGRAAGPAITERTTTMSDFTELAERYIAMWNETDPAARRALISEIWSEDGQYIDPLAEVSGHDGIDAVVAGAQAQFPGMTFRLASAVDAHHDQ